MRARYDAIYRDIRESIENGTYPYQSFLPSEAELTSTYECSHNTLRRALGLLRDQGYVQPVHGKGVRVIYQEPERTTFTVGGIESFLESAVRNRQTPRTKVLQFAELEAGEKISRKTGFPLGTPLYYLQRLRYLDGTPLILDHNYFRKDLIPGLTPEIAEHSIYEYLEQTLGFSIATSKRTMTVERVTQIDETYIEMNDYNCMAVITSQTFNDDGIQFEYTQSRHRPDHFQFQDVAVRKRTD